MKLGRIARRAPRRIEATWYRLLDALYVPLDRKRVRRTRNILLIPHEGDRRGGKYSYAEWAYTIGIFQTLMFLHLRSKEDNRILDVGCGTGLLGVACEPFLGQNGKYTGIDVMKQDIDFCRRHYPPSQFEFIHLDAGNPRYAPGQKNSRVPWPVESGTFDLTTALSVWTHLNEEDALFYFTETSRVLKPGGKAIVTFFLLDDTYRSGVDGRSKQAGRFHTTAQDRWIFDQPCYGSDAWFHPQWAHSAPEAAVGVTEAGVDRLASVSGLTLIEHHPGTWKEIPGLFFQDVLIFQRT